MSSKLTLSSKLACVTTAALIIPMLAPATASAAAMMPKMTKQMSFWDAMSSGESWLTFRPRYEYVSEDNTLRNANALTLRTELGYKTGNFNGFDATVEFANVTSLMTHANSNTGGGTSSGDALLYSVVADPSNTVVNQAFLNFNGIDGSNVSVGRQRINLVNERFVGDYSWRQTSTRFDSIMATNTSLPNTKITYAYAWGVERIFGVAATGAFKRYNAESHFVNANFSPAKWGSFVPYAYLINNKNSAATSVDTYGIRFTGESPEYSNGISAFYTAEYASQKGSNNNPSRVKSHYTSFELGAKNKMFSLMVGQELLSGNGTVSFITPYASLHKFNGWADMFVATPAAGLKDAYAGLSANAWDLTAAATYHQFRNENVNTRLGNELDVSVSKDLPNNINVLAKYADYRAKTTATVNTKKFWLQTSVKFN